MYYEIIITSRIKVLNYTHNCKIFCVRYLVGSVYVRGVFKK